MNSALATNTQTQNQTHTHTFTEFSGIEALQIDIASSFGLDKEDWDVRLDWVEAHEHELENQSLVKEADTPALYWAGVQAYRRAQKGLPTGFPVSLDATASVIQLLAALVGCAASARLSNLIPTGHRVDPYKALYKTMCAKTGDMATISRKTVKEAMMPALYNSKAEPIKVFGRGPLLDAFFATLNDELPGAWALTQSLLQLWQPYALHHAWVLPDNFHVHKPVESTATKTVQFMGATHPVRLTVNQGAERGLSISPDIIHSVDALVVREVNRRCGHDPEKIRELLTMHRSRVTRIGRAKDRMVQTLWQHYLDSGFLSARILDHLDAGNIGLVDQKRIFQLIGTLPKKPFPVLTIHDGFRAHPNHATDLRRQYNQVLSEIAASNLLCFIASQVVGHMLPVAKMGDISQQILSADYAIC